MMTKIFVSDFTVHYFVKNFETAGRSASPKETATITAITALTPDTALFCAAVSITASIGRPRTKRFSIKFF